MFSENYLLAELHDIVTKSVIMTGRGPLSNVLRNAGYGVFGAKRSIEAVPASVQLSKLLQVPLHSPLLLVSSVSWAKNKRVFDYYLSWVRSDAVKITVEAQGYPDLREGSKFGGILPERGMKN